MRSTRNRRDDQELVALEEAPPAADQKLTDQKPHHFKSGQKVKGKFGASAHGSFAASWYPAKVTASHDDATYDLAYDDGDKEKRVPHKFIRACEATAPAKATKPAKKPAVPAKPARQPAVARKRKQTTAAAASSAAAGSVEDREPPSKRASKRPEPSVGAEAVAAAQTTGVGPGELALFVDGSWRQGEAAAEEEDEASMQEVMGQEAQGSSGTR